MRLFNTLSRRVEELEFPAGTVKMYVCGITPYDTSHLGHARVGIVYDTLRRYLQYQGLDVIYVQNVTDIDDPLFERARRDGEDWRELGERQTRRYLQSLAALNVARPDYFIPATSAIPQMLPIIQQLIDEEHAYLRDGWVYYRAASFPRLGELAHAGPAQLLEMANEMGNNPDDPRKEEPLDFVLWQTSAPDEPAWDSPWGKGRPGWHIECSTMATTYLGPQVDIHGGGADLIFPHHACEIAQAEPVTGVTPFVRYWMHVGLVGLDGTKMSKSLGNMVFVEDVLGSYSAAGLRAALLAHGYRETIEYDEQDVAAAERGLDSVRQALATPEAPDGTPVDLSAYHERFLAALDDDLDTPAALHVLWEAADATLAAASEDGDTVPARDTLREMLDLLGLGHGHE